MAHRLMGVVAMAAVAGVVAPTVWMTPAFHVPFPCGQVWTGATRTNHNPPQAVDFNRPGDEGDEIVASAPGTIAVVAHEPDGYGRYVVVDHGHGWESRYAHLRTITVRVGQRVADAEPIGTVGSTGVSTGAHLHYEQRFRGRPMRVVFDARETGSQEVRAHTRARCA